MDAIPVHEIEWFIPDPSLAVRQGDVLVCRDLATGKVDEICLVITADCDISKGKFGRQLACLRIVRLDEYIRTVWAARKLDNAIRAETKKLREQIAKWHTKLLGTDSTLTAEAVISWVRRAEPSAMCDSLQIPDVDRKKFVASVSASRDALRALDANEVKGKLAQLVAFRAASRSMDLGACYKEVLQQARGEELPDDVFLLPSLPQVGEEAAVVLLREVVGISKESVCYRTTEAQSNDLFLRVGRLQPTFKYGVSQAFGALYSKIGFSDHYEARCKSAIDSISNLEWE